MTPEEVRDIAFRKAPFGSRGFDEEQVDLLLDRVEATLRGDPQISRDELAQTKFGKPPIGKRGYRREDVDAFIQRVLLEWSIWR